MAETSDPYKLSSGTPQEEAYAAYASQMKSLANQARKEILSTGKDCLLTIGKGGLSGRG